MNDKNVEHKRAKAALSYIIPILVKYNFKWVITGGFACYVYGVDRMLTDIDIDIETSKDSIEFKQFIDELKPYITQPLENFVNDNYNNFNFEITYQDQIIDICPMNELLIFNRNSNKYVSFYDGKFPEVEMMDFEGFKLPLLSKVAIIDNKVMLTDKDEWQMRDIKELRNLL